MADVERIERQTFSCEEVAVMVGVSAKTIARRVAVGDLRVVKIGRAVRVTREELDRFLGREPR